MAIFATICGALTGSLAALSSALVQGTDWLAALGIYYGVALIISFVMIAANAMAPRRNELHRAP